MAPTRPSSGHACRFVLHDAASAATRMHAASSCPSRFVSINAPSSRVADANADAVPVDEPERDEERGEGEEVVEQEVRLRLERAVGDARRDDHERHHRPEDERGDARGQQPYDRGREPTEEEPELEVEADDIRRAHELERGRLQRRKERRVARVRQLSEELLVEPAEEVDRLRLRDPERPRVPGRQAREPPRTEQRLRGSTTTSAPYTAATGAIPLNEPVRHTGAGRPRRAPAATPPTARTTPVSTTEASENGMPTTSSAESTTPSPAIPSM